MKKIKTITLILFTALFVLSSHTLFAEMMSSGSYKIQSDSANFGGGQGNSSGYRVEDTYGEVGTGDIESSSYRLHAGYQQMHEVYVAITAAADVTMSPSLGGLTGGTSNGSTAVTVTTDSFAGYELSIKASTSPALDGNSIADSIADYTPVGADPDFTFSVAATDSEFGFTPEGTDIADKYKDNGSACNTGSGDSADACWYGLSTSDEVISRRTSGNHPNGITTTVKYRTVVGTSRAQLEGTYTATTTLTVVSL